MTPDHSFGDLSLAAVEYRLASPLMRTKLNTYPGKITINDYEEDSDPRLSTWGIIDVTGGHGVADIKEGVDRGRCRWSTLNTRYPGQIAPPAKATQYTAASNTDGARPLGDISESGTYRFYAAYGVKLVKWNEGGPAFGASLGDLAGVPVNKAVEFVGTGTRRLFIPLGANGYATYESAGGLVAVATPLAKAFCLWDTKLICLDTAGQLHYTTDGTAWTSWGADAKIDGSYIPRNLVVYFDQASNATVFVITNRGALAFDPNGPRLYPVEALDWPPHPHQALGSAKWRGHLYISIGMGTRRYTGDIAQPMGLDRDEGLPLDWRGRVLDTEPESNGLYQLCVGYEQGGISNPHLQVWTDYGWHTVWASVDANGIRTVAATSKVTWSRVSEAQGVHRIWWGDGTGNLKTIVLPTDDANPRSQVDAETGDFAPGFWEIQTGRFDAGMPGYDKVADHLTVKMGGVDDGTGQVIVYHRINGETTWTLLGGTSPGFGIPAHVDLNQFGTALPHNATTNDYSGLLFRDIEFRVTFENAGTTEAAYIEAITFYFMKKQPAARAWQTTVDLTAGNFDQSPEDLFQHLESLMDAGLFFEMSWKDGSSPEYARVQLTSLDSPEATGHDTRTVATIGILEVPDDTTSSLGV